MSDVVISALITGAVSLCIGGLTFIGVIISNSKASRETQSKFDKELAVTNTKVDDLTREVREHNGFATRIPVCEMQIKELQNDIKILRDLINKYHIGN